MNRAGQIAKPDGAHRDALDHPGLAADRGDVADMNRVLEQNEHAGDEILDQGLGAETDGEAGDAGAGQHGPDVDADLRQRHHGRHQRDHHQKRVPDQRQQGAHPGRPHQPFAALVLPLQVDVDHAGRHFPDNQRDQQDRADGNQPAEQIATQIAAQPAEHVEPPGLQDQEQRDQLDRPGDDPAKQRQIAVGAILDERVFGADLVADPEDPPDHPIGKVEGDPGHDNDQDGGDRGLRQIGEAARDLERPDHEHAGEIEHRQDVPDLGHPVAQHPHAPRRQLIAAEAGDPPGHRLAVLQHQHPKEQQ